jgi:hypothetical protein
MATIITVHGTNATGPEFGDRWWQKGSPFETHLRSLVGSEDSDLKYEPLIWDGANSEVSRRKAAKALVALVNQCEAKRERYCVIGHSHGGSIVAQALMNLASSRCSPTMLARWITIGTPFISFTKSTLLFSRLGLIGKSLYVALLTYFFLIVSVFLYVISVWNQFAAYDFHVRITFIALLFVSVAAPFMLAYVGMRLLTRRQFSRYRRANRIRFSEEFAGLWVALWHPSDEAICGLKAIKDLRLTIFSKYFAAPSFAFLSIFLIPITIAVLGVWPHAAYWLLNNENFYLGSGKIMPESAPGTYIQNVVAVGGVMLEPILLYSGDVAKKGNAVFAALLMLTVLPAALFAVSLTVTFVVGGVARGISAVASKVLNRMTNQQIAKSAFGSDMRGEYASTALEYPIWVDSGFAPLPGALCDEISEFSDHEAAKSLAKFRKAIGQLTFSESKTETANFVQSYLGWDELIHTCYFNVPRFRKLVAYVVSTAAGFRATEQFQKDPDYAIVKGWFEKIRLDKHAEVVGQGMSGPSDRTVPGLGGVASPEKMVAA